jgi:porphobilinogen deaminase
MSFEIRIGTRSSALAIAQAEIAAAGLPEAALVRAFTGLTDREIAP